MENERILDPTVSGLEAGELEASLKGKIVGQDDAIRQIVSVYQAFVAGLAAPGRPIGNFLFLGPTGTGKTRLVEALAESLAGDIRAVIKVDCAEFQHSHEIAKLIGSPPGYLGHRETHPALSQETINKYQTEKLKLSFVLFDEIEKASDALWNLLLGVLDKATLTLGDNRQVDFSRCMIFMTSNLGAREMMATLNPGVGFTPQPPRPAEVIDDIERAATEAARRRFTPEFLNRIDKVLVFHPLGEAELKSILDMELAALRRRFRESNAVARFEFALTEQARDFLLREGTDVRYGARHLKRALERALVYPISNLLASAQLQNGDCVRVDFDPERQQLQFFRRPGILEAAEAERQAESAAGSQAEGAVAAAGARAARAPATRRHNLMPIK
jgi:ATP-dependent Clp protease ATP-binding subunit ClpA